MEGYLFAIGLVLISSLIYCGSLRLKPWVKCSKCDGQPRVKAAQAVFAIIAQSFSSWASPSG